MLLADVACKVDTAFFKPLLLLLPGMCGCRGASGFLLLPGEGKRLLLLAMADERLLLAIEERLLLLATEERLLLLVGVEGLRAGATLWS